MCLIRAFPGRLARRGCRGLSWRAGEAFVPVRGKAEHNMRAGEAEGSLKTMREQEDTLNTHLIDVQGMSYLDPHLLQMVMPAIIFGPA